MFDNAGEFDGGEEGNDEEVASWDKEDVQQEEAQVRATPPPPPPASQEPPLAQPQAASGFAADHAFTSLFTPRPAHHRASLASSF